MARTVQGLAHTWQISDTPIGSGDAGEVYAVTRFEQPQVTGVMKKPARVATGGTIQRQAGQIAQEARALALLDGLPSGKAHPPRLLDQAPEFTHGTANYFIISETAPGENLNVLLAAARQTGQPFPRRVIMTVLDALFDMFSRAHQAGVLWNDVKLEHIYWHNPTGRVGVIDWGNALFLDPGGQGTRPRWEDYQQMVDSLGAFLQSAAPDLFVDLGWDEFLGKTLDSSRVSTLARRIAYQQQVIALQVMEYQSLIRVVLTSEPSLEGLRKIADYQHILLKIGAPWYRDEILQYCQSLVKTALAHSDIQTAVSATALVWEIFDDSLDLPWHLLREYCRHTDILTHPAFPDLAKHTLNAAWEDALWHACVIASQNQGSIWWPALIPVMRQQALGSTIPSPYQAAQALRNWAEQQGQHALLPKLDTILGEWRSVGADLTRSPFDDALLDLMRSGLNMPGHIKSELRQSYAQGEEPIRELIKAWQNARWDELPKAFRRIISWDPDRRGVLALAHQTELLGTWLTTLYDGPGFEVSAREFLANMLATRPNVEHALGSTPWLGGLIQALNAILQGAAIAAHQEVINSFCPWLLSYPDIHAADFQLPEVEEGTLQALLKEFTQQLKGWREVEAGLSDIRQHAPRMLSACQTLVDGFKQIFSLNANLEQIGNAAQRAESTALNEGYSVLQALITWREHLAEGDLATAIECVTPFEQAGWALAAQARRVTTHWHQVILPALDAIQSLTSIPELGGGASSTSSKLLGEISQTCQELKHLWGQLYHAGIYSHLLEVLGDKIVSTRSAFLDWRVSQENSPDPVERLVYLTQLEVVRQISSCFLRMSHHIHQARLGFALLGEDDQSSLTMQHQNIENILYHLSALETVLIADPGERRFPEYQAAIERIAQAQTLPARQALIDALTDDHPFYAWLVKSTRT